MRRFMTFAVGIVAVLCWTTPGFSATDHSYSGKIIMIDPKLRIFIVKGNNGREETFHPDRYSTFTIDGQPKLLAELQRGEEVTITYKETSNQMSPAHAGTH